MAVTVENLYGNEDASASVSDVDPYVIIRDSSDSLFLCGKVKFPQGCRKSAYTRGDVLLLFFVG
jgi:hypothetical protein